MKRRDFLTTGLTVTALGSLSAAFFKASAAEPDRAGPREYYELRIYRLKSAAAQPRLDAYLEKAALPAWNRLGLKPLGVFTETEPNDGPSVFVLIPYPSLESFVSSAAKINADAEYLKAGADYLRTAKADPAFVRIDSWLMLAFAGMPKLELPSYCPKAATRVFELRAYESHSELKAVNKVDMFNAGEIGTMREVGLGPVFYGQALIGANLPHLWYMTSGENPEVHKQHWSLFGKHPVWQKLKSDLQYADNVSKITVRMMTPTAYSQI
jgi:hypothetical protein